MATSPFVVERFGGLNLAADPSEVGAQGAVNLLDVDLGTLGQLRARAGYAKFTAAAKAGVVSSIASVYPRSGAVAATVLAWGGGTYYAIGSTGTVTSSSSPASSTVAPMWSPGPFTYATYDGSAGRIIKWSAGIWTTLDISSSVDTSDTWSVIGSTPYSDRLVLAGGTTTPDRIVFSDPGGGAWTANNFVELPNDDGAVTTGAVTYRDTLILFKENKYYVFGTEGVDGSGNPEFFYRAVATGVGLAGRFGAAAAPEGVYFVARDGVYLTQGGGATKVSGALDPMFRGGDPASGPGLDVAHAYISQAAATYYRERLYVAITTGASTTNNRLLVFDPKTGAWVVWSIPAASLCPHRPTVGADEELFFGYATGTNDIGRHFRSYTQDDGSAFSWTYLSGKYPVSDPGRVAVITESSLTGYSSSSSVTLDVGSDSLGFPGGAGIHFGVAPNSAEGYLNQDNEGKLFQHFIAGNLPTTVERLTHWVSFVKPAGVQ